MRSLRFPALQVVAVATLWVAAAPAVERNEIPSKLTWNLADLYADEAAWTAAKTDLAKRIPELGRYQGHLGDSAAKLHEALAWRLALPINFSWRKEPTETSFRFGIKIMIANLLQYLNYRSDILLIGFFLTQTEVGWYYVSVMIGERLLFLTQATATVLLPAASSSDIQREKTPLLSRLNFTVVFAGSVVIGVTAYWLVPLLFSSVYGNSVLPLVVILPGIIALSVSKILSAGLTSRGLPQYSLYVSLLNFSLNISFNIIFIPRLGIVGAALSSTLSYTAALLLQVYFYYRLTNTSLTELILFRNGDLKKLKSI